MRVQLLDPSAFTPPYDRALAAGLVRGGAQVRLLTSRFLYGPVPGPEGFEVDEFFYRRVTGRGLQAPGRRVLKAGEHLADLVRFRRHGGWAGERTPPEITHHQWFTFPAADPWLMPRRRPQVATAHYILPPAPSRRERLAARSAYRRMDAVIAHSEHGAARLRDEVGLPAEKVHVIPHGVFEYLTRLQAEMPLPRELTEPGLGGTEAEAANPAPPTRPVVLFFGLLRPYKSIDVLLEAFRSVPDCELWIVGNPRMDVEPLRQAARQSASPVRFATRFIDEAEIPSVFRRADLVVLPYRDIEQSGVLYTALAFGKPLVLTSVGGFPEVIERTGAGRLVPPGDPVELAATLNRLVADLGARAELSHAAAAAARGEYSWDRIAGQTLELYRSLLG